VSGTAAREATASGPRGGRDALAQWLAYHAYRLAGRIAQRLPEPAGRWLFRSGGRAARALLPAVRATVEENQAQVLGLSRDHELVRAAGREAFDLYSRYWFDTFRLPIMSTPEFEERFVLEGWEQLDRDLEAGRGSIVVLPHMGNWDAAGHCVAVNGYPIASVAEELKPRRLFQLFIAHREELGMRIVGLTADGTVGRQLAGLLADNWVVALVADRDLGGRGIEVQMFGRARRLPAGPALLSLTTGAPLHVAPVYTTPSGWVCRIGSPISTEAGGDRRRAVAAITRVVAGEFERAIAAAPTDWHMFQPAWE
jgi:phosphatidylinositol dimannoside acyltransferase